MEGESREYLQESRTESESIKVDEWFIRGRCIELNPNPPRPSADSCTLVAVETTKGKEGRSGKDEDQFKLRLKATVAELARGSYLLTTTAMSLRIPQIQDGKDASPHQSLKAKILLSMVGSDGQVQYSVTAMPESYVVNKLIPPHSKRPLLIRISFLFIFNTHRLRPKKLP